ncbi:IS481 family transposase [Hamadaea sp. NPDC051192]|uniref:IS481 family transposase n=1 Tax=Hamadaea sp. NPDC051192 TaxID=3154940 RepID=UPI00341B7EDF
MDGGAGVANDGGRAWLVEQRYRAVLEVLDGSPVSEVAIRYGVTRQSVYLWKAKYEAGGIEALKERSRRPRTSPTRLDAEVEAAVCQLRREHPRWGARRIAYELAMAGVRGAPSRVTVHRVLVRNGLVQAQEQRHKRKYRRWQREAPMQLWQMDLVGGVFLADGRECKLLTGIDDHSRFVVLARVLSIPSGRAVTDAFTAAMRSYGVPLEVLTDNGKQFTGRFTKPRPAEVLFERVCRGHGITARLTKPRSPTTTGKIERFHQTLRRELLDVAGPFADLPAAQAAITAWVHAYNHNRPHQGIDMAVPASLFRPNLPSPPTATGEGEPAPVATARMDDPPTTIQYASAPAVEFDTVIAPSGQLAVIPAVQRVRMGAQLAGLAAHVWADEFSIHISIDGRLVKTVASNLTSADLDTLRMRGARLAGPSPALPSPAKKARAGQLPAGTTIELERKANFDGVVILAGKRLKLGVDLAEHRLTLRLDGHLAHVIHDGMLVKTLALPIAIERLSQLRGARTASGPLPPAALGTLSVQRRIPPDGVVMVTRQRLRVGRTYAGQLVTVFVEDTHLRVVHDGEEIALFPRQEQRKVFRFKATEPRSPRRPPVK